MNKYVDDRNRKEYSVSEAGKAILQELQTMLSTDGKFLKKVSQDRYVGVDSESALQSKYYFHPYFVHGNLGLTLVDFC